MRKFSSFWHIQDNIAKDTAFLFKDLEKTLSYKGELITSDPISSIIKTDINNSCYYIKVYTKAGKRLKHFIGRSRFQGEWENLMFFQKLGIPTPEVVAFGQESSLKIFKTGALVLKEAENTMDLAAIAKNNPELLKQKKWIEQIGLLYAKYTRRLHENKFIHIDLKWRNILVTMDKKPKVFFIDCPSGGKKNGVLLYYGMIKDLACLDKIARRHLSKTTRLKFYLMYKNKNSTNKQDKEFIKHILSYFNTGKLQKILFATSWIKLITTKTK